MMPKNRQQQLQRRLQTIQSRLNRANKMCRVLSDAAYQAMETVCNNMIEEKFDIIKELNK